MTHKEEVRLNRLLAKIEAMRDIVLCLQSELGRWDDGTGKKSLVFQVDKAEISDVCVKHQGTFDGKYCIQIGGFKGKFNLTDTDLEKIIDEGVESFERRKAKAKQRADAERQKKSNVSYIDVFKRVSEFIKKNGYGINTPSKETDAVVMKIGKNILHWTNVKDFVSATFDGKHHANFGTEWNCPSIFATVGCWTRKYYKLAYPSLKKLVDKMKVLGEVSEGAIVPVAVMDELNRLKI